MKVLIAVALLLSLNVQAQTSLTFNLLGVNGGKYAAFFAAGYQYDLWLAEVAYTGNPLSGDPEEPVSIFVGRDIWPYKNVSVIPMLGWSWYGEDVPEKGITVPKNAPSIKLYTEYKNYSLNTMIVLAKGRTTLGIGAGVRIPFARGKNFAHMEE